MAITMRGEKALDEGDPNKLSFIQCAVNTLSSFRTGSNQYFQQNIQWQKNRSSPSQIAATQQGPRLHNFRRIGHDAATAITAENNDSHYKQMLQNEIDENTTSKSLSLCIGSIVACAQFMAG